MSEVHIAVAIFVVTYGLIMSDRIDKTTAALTGGMAVVAFKILDSEHAFGAIDLNVIFLLAGMMIIANMMTSTGIFEWLAIRSAQLVHANPIWIMTMLCAITAVGSSLFDNVTTVVIVAPVTIFVAQTLRINPVPLLIGEVLASNIGGTSTLIGDPPNILIGSYADIDFLTFLTNVAPVAIISLLVFLIGIRWLVRGQLNTTSETREALMRMDTSKLITDHRTLRITSIVLSFVMLAFLLQGWIGYEPAAVALMGAAILLVITRKDTHDVLAGIEWSTLFFFVGLFMVVGGLEEVGVLQNIGVWATDLTGDSAGASLLMILWMSALLSGVVDNIPYTATMLPIVDEFVQGSNGSVDANSFWWALAIGADMGGNLTIIAASANVLVANLATREGYPISFWLFFRYGVITTFVTMLIASAYIWLRFVT